MTSSESEQERIQKYGNWLFYSKIGYNFLNFVSMCWCLYDIRAQPTPYDVCFLLLLASSVVVHGAFEGCAQRPYKTYIYSSMVLLVGKLCLLMMVLVFGVQTMMILTGVNISAHIGYDIIVGLIKNTGLTYDLQPYLPYTNLEMIVIND